MTTKPVFAALGLALAVGCGGGGASVTFSGTVRGQTISPKEAISANATVTVGTTTANVAAIVLSSQTNTCANAAAAKEPKNSQYFVILLGVFSLTSTGISITPPAKPDTFTVWDPVHGSSVPPGNLAVVLSEVTDAQCQVQGSAEAVGIAGQVKVTSISNNAYSGTFDITLTDGDGQTNSVPNSPTYKVSGSFQAQACQSISQLIQLQRSTQCI